MATRDELYAAIEREREYQQQKWPTDGKPLDLYGRMIVAHEELKEALLAYCKNTSNDEALRELLQVVVVGVRWQGQWGDWRKTENAYINDVCTLPQWLRRINGLFIQADTLLPEDELIYPRQGDEEQRDIFDKIIAMGVAALLQHGIVEREELAEQPTLTLTQTPRGLDFLEFQDVSGQTCTLQKSELFVDEGLIWLGMRGEKQMHLTREQVSALLPFLIQFAETGELS